MHHDPALSEASQHGQMDGAGWKQESQQKLKGGSWKGSAFLHGLSGTEDTSEYLSDALVATLRGIIADSTNRTNSILFKCAVEQGIMAHTIAAHFRDTLEDRRALRGYVVDEVKAHQWSDQVRGCPGCPTAAAG